MTKRKLVCIASRVRGIKKMTQNWGIFFATPCICQKLSYYTVPLSQARYTLFGNVCATFLNQIKKKVAQKTTEFFKKRGQFSFADFGLIIIVTLFPRSFIFCDILSHLADKNKRQLYFRQLWIFIKKGKEINANFLEIRKTKL